MIKGKLTYSGVRTRNFEPLASQSTDYVVPVPWSYVCVYKNPLRLIYIYMCVYVCVCVCLYACACVYIWLSVGVANVGCDTFMYLRRNSCIMDTHNFVHKSVSFVI